MRSVSMIGAATALAVFALAVLPDVVLACPVCFDASDENRKAFFATAVFLSLFPLGMVAGAGLWLRKRAREAHDSERRSRDELDA